MKQKNADVGRCYTVVDGEPALALLIFCIADYKRPMDYRYLGVFINESELLLMVHQL